MVTILIITDPDGMIQGDERMIDSNYNLHLRRIYSLDDKQLII
jgi:hypothetical protein